MSCDHVLVLGYGGPASKEEVRPFLRAVSDGRRIPEPRLREAERRYEAIGNHSPYQEQAARFSHELSESLAKKGLKIPVFVGMRNSPPFLKNVVPEIRKKGFKQGLALALAPHRSEASFGRYVSALEEAKSEAGAGSLQYDFLPPWHEDPAFVQAVAEEARKTLSEIVTVPTPPHSSAKHRWTDPSSGGDPLPLSAENRTDASFGATGARGSVFSPLPRGAEGEGEGRVRVGERFSQITSELPKNVHLLFTAHSIPVSMANESRYVEEVLSSSSRVAEALQACLRASHRQAKRWSLAYQSRSGCPNEPWLRPDPFEEIETLIKTESVNSRGDRPAARILCVAPIGFLCENMELLYDLDIELAAKARRLGLDYHRAKTVILNPRFIQMVADLICAMQSRRGMTTVEIPSPSRSRGRGSG